ncbi:glucooligosaccharide oxidase [Teratosphaeria destructans]|uniref:Glucooligosaccharide oxidase n=1 Tax=Teratosphaeria destructans TaxID=418781 RepID=A0A9W7VYT3_9PEZI|nr:glucooligosaccharide oxidase [Teratosphaeria destructans]
MYTFAKSSIVLLCACTFALAKSDFKQCIEAALNHEFDLYAFPGGFDIFYQQIAVHPYNLDYPLTPAAVTYPKTSEQVAAVVSCAHSAGIGVQARSGGHSYLNYGLGGTDGALVVDMKHFTDFTYNSDETVTFGAGNKLRDLTQKLKAINRVMAYGVTPSIGSGGHMTIGGIGPLGRQYGLGCDQIVSMKLVLASGKIVQASAVSETDLYFAMRGAGFSFAIVTEFTMQTFPSPGDAIQYNFNVSVSDTKGLAKTFKEWQTLISQPDLTRKFASVLTLTNDVMIISGTFYGSEAEFGALNLGSKFAESNLGLKVTSEIATKLVYEVEEAALATVGDLPVHFYGKSLKYTNKTLMSDQAIDAMFDYIDKADKGTLIWVVIWDLEGGAISDLAQDATAYWNRDALYFLETYVVSLVGKTDQKSIDFADGLNKVIQQNVPGIDDSAYPGYVDNRLPDPQKSYWGGNVARLQKIKAAVDPDNVFRNPQTIQGKA